jgi:hypothetical protein
MNLEGSGRGLLEELSGHLVEEAEENEKNKNLR